MEKETLGNQDGKTILECKIKLHENIGILTSYIVGWWKIR